MINTIQQLISVNSPGSVIITIFMSAVVIAIFMLVLINAFINSIKKERTDSQCQNKKHQTKWKYLTNQL